MEKSSALLEKVRIRAASLRSHIGWARHLCFPASFFFWEMVFSGFINGETPLYSVMEKLFFSLAVGGVLEILTSLLPKGKGNRILRLCFLFFLAVPYMIEYFIHYQFRVFYDVATVINGAGGVATGFLSEVLRLILSPTGLLFLALALLPGILYAVFGLRRDSANRLSPRRAGALAGAALLAFGIGKFLVDSDGYSRGLYGDEYSFDAAVEQFGLFTGICLDLKLGGEQEQLVFEPVAPLETVSASAPTERIPTEPEETEPVVYGKNELPLDFSKCRGTESSLAEYVQGLEASSKNPYTGLFAGKNMIMITAEAFTAEVISPELTPTLYRLANSGFQFTDYYQPTSSGTTGGEVLNLLGILPMLGGDSMGSATSHHAMTLASFLTEQGYVGGAFHNNDYTFYNRDRTHNHLGYPDGFTGFGNGAEEYVKGQWPQSDLEMLEGTLPGYIAQGKPFNLYYMSVSGHSVYTQDANAMTRKNWDKVENLDYSEKVKCYLACQLELENALAYTVKALEDAGIADDTVICISADHFPYGLDDSSGLGATPYLNELYGFEVETRLQRDHNRLILWCGSLEKEPPVEISSPVTSMDILPTLCNLFGVDFDSRLMVGRDVFSDTEALAFNSSFDWKTDLGEYNSRTQAFTPSDPDREIPEGYVEQIRQMVKNKINYCRGVLQCDFFGHVLPD